MSIGAAIMAFALVGTAQAAGPQPAYEVSDDHFASAAANDYLLDLAVRSALFADTRLEAELRRVGLERGCLLIDAARRRAVDENSAAFRSHLVAAMRAFVPADEIRRPGAHLIAGGLQTYRNRVTREVERTGKRVYDGAVASARSQAERALAAAPRVAPAAWAGRFADWRLDRPSARQTACSLIASTRMTAEQFARAKSVFDGFYRRSGE